MYNSSTVDDGMTFTDKRIILTDEIIEQLLKNIEQRLEKKESINFVGNDPKEQGSSSPLTYAIYNNKPELFFTLLEAGADVNFSVYENWRPLTYAIRQDNPIFLATLLNHPDIDLYFRNNDDNFIGHILNVQEYKKHLSEKSLTSHLKTVFTFLKNKKDFDHDQFFDGKSVFEDIWPHDSHYKAVFKFLPSKWAKKHIDHVFDNKHYSYSFKPPHIALQLLDMFGKDEKIVQKICKHLDSETILPGNNTLLHHYLFKNFNNAKTYDKTYEYVIKNLVAVGYDALKYNDDDVSPHRQLMEYNFYSEPYLQRMRNELEADSPMVEKKTRRYTKV